MRPGATVAVWEVGRYADGDADLPDRIRVEAARELPDGTFSSPTRLSASGGRSDAAATTSTAVVKWQERRRLKYSLDLRPGKTLSRAADHSTLAAAGDHAVIAYASGRTIRLATLQRE